MAGAVLGWGLCARVHVLGRVRAPRARAVAAQPHPRRAVQPLAMANPFEDKKKEAAKRALMAALEGKQDVLKENELKEAARLKAGGGSGGGGRSGGSGGGGGDGGGKWRKETGTTLQTFLIIVGAVRALQCRSASTVHSPPMLRRNAPLCFCTPLVAPLTTTLFCAACAFQHLAPASRPVHQSHLCVVPVRCVAAFVLRSLARRAH